MSLRPSWVSSQLFIFNSPCLAGAAGCVATLLHDAAMNPAEGNTVFPVCSIFHEDNYFYYHQKIFPCLWEERETEQLFLQILFEWWIAMTGICLFVCLFNLCVRPSSSMTCLQFRKYTMIKNKIKTFLKNKNSKTSKKKKTRLKIQFKIYKSKVLAS